MLNNVLVKYVPLTSSSANINNAVKCIILQSDMDFADVPYVKILLKAQDYCNGAEK